MPRAATIPTTTTITGPAGSVDVPDLVTVSVQITPAPQALDGFIPAVGVYVDGNLRNNEPIAADGSAVSSLSLAAGSHEVYASVLGVQRLRGEPERHDHDRGRQRHDHRPEHPAASPLSTPRTSRTPPPSPASTATRSRPAAPPVGGTLTITDTTTSAVLGTLAVTATAHTLAVTKKLSVGSHALKATYSGDGLYRVFERAPDRDDPGRPRRRCRRGVEHADDVLSGRRHVQGHADDFRGSRREPIAVAIRIYSVSTGKLVRAASIALGSGAYSWSWNGRSTAGALVPAGSYRIVQTLTDTAANRLAVTTTAALSHKRLYWHTATVTKYGDAYSVKGDPGTGSVSRSASGYYRGVRLASGRSWVAVSYPFTIPSATVYGTFTFKVLGRSTNGTRATSAIWNPGWGSYLQVESYGAAKLIGPAYRWWSTSGPGSAFHSGRTARAEVFLEYGPGAKVFDVAKVSMAGAVRPALVGPITR